MVSNTGSQGRVGASRLPGPVRTGLGQYRDGVADVTGSPHVDSVRQAGRIGSDSPNDDRRNIPVAGSVPMMGGSKSGTLGPDMVTTTERRRNPDPLARLFPVDRGADDNRAVPGPARTGQGQFTGQPNVRPVAVTEESDDGRTATMIAVALIGLAGIALVGRS
jgi:hypothetical protein